MENKLVEQVDAEIAHLRREKILKLKRVGVMAWLELGKELYNAKIEKDWICLDFNSWNAYCAAPENSGGLDLSRNWVISFSEVYRVYQLKFSLPADRLLKAGPSKLYEIKE